MGILERLRGRQKTSSRLIVYPAEFVRSMRPDAEGNITGGREGTQTPDEFAGKLVKYVPAETIAFASVFTVFDLPDLAIWAMFVVAVLGTPFYFAYVGWQPLFARLLTIPAAIAWIVGTTSVGTDLLHLPYDGAKAILVVTTFVLPIVDSLLQRKYERAHLN